MKVKLMRRILIGLTFVSTLTTAVFITWKIVKNNNVEVESRTNSRLYKPIDIAKDDYYKVVDYKNNNYVFNLNNAEYYLVHKTLSLYPELANKEFSFSVDNKKSPKALMMSIGTENETKWFYSII